MVQSTYCYQHSAFCWLAQLKKVLAENQHKGSDCFNGHALKFTCLIREKVKSH